MYESTTALGPDARAAALDLIVLLEAEETSAGRADLAVRLRNATATGPGEARRPGRADELSLIAQAQREETDRGRRELGERLRDLLAGRPGPLGWCGLCERRPATVRGDHSYAGGAEEVLLGQHACAACYRECWALARGGRLEGGPSA